MPTENQQAPAGEDPLQIPRISVAAFGGGTGNQLLPPVGPTLGGSPIPKSPVSLADQIQSDLPNGGAASFGSAPIAVPYPVQKSNLWLWILLAGAGGLVIYEMKRKKQHE